MQNAVRQNVVTDFGMGYLSHLHPWPENRFRAMLPLVGLLPHGITTLYRCPYWEVPLIAKRGIYTGTIAVRPGKKEYGTIEFTLKGRTYVFDGLPYPVWPNEIATVNLFEADSQGNITFVNLMPVPQVQVTSSSRFGDEKQRTVFTAEPSCVVVQPLIEGNWGLLHGDFETGLHPISGVPQTRTRRGDPQGVHFAKPPEGYVGPLGVRVLRPGIPQICAIGYSGQRLAVSAFLPEAEARYEAESAQEGATY